MNERKALESRTPSSRMLLVLAGLGFCVSLAFGGCKPKAQSGATAQAQGSVVKRIQGLWSTGCHVWGSANLSRLIEVAITKDEVTLFQYEYSDSQCQLIRGRVSSTTPYLPLAVDEAGGLIEIATQPRSAVVKPGSQAELDRLQEQKYCGSGEWSKGEEKNVSLTGCGEIFLDAAKNGIVATFRVTPSGDLYFGSLPTPLKRQRIQPKPATALALTDQKPRNKTVFLAEAFLPPEKRSKPRPEDIQFGFAPETFQVQQCPDQTPGKGPEACGDFTPNMRKACEYCNGGIDTCQKATRWDLKFAQALVTQLQTRPPGGVCKPPGSEVGVIDPTESHDQTRAAAEAEVALLNNAQLDGTNPDALAAEGAVGPAEAQQQGAPQAPVQVSAEEERLKKAKELVAHGVGFGASFASPLCGPWAPACFIGATVLSGAITHGTGQLLDRLLPTANADAARQQQQQQQQAPAQQF